MRPEELESELLLYWIQSRELEEKGGPEEAGELFDALLIQEETILEAFGLPPAEKYNKILWKLAEKKSCTPKTVQKTLEKLQQVAQRFFEKPVMPTLDMLKKAAKRKENPFNLLPELGFITHTYTIFLYEELLQKNLAPAEEILQEIEIVHAKELYGPVAVLQNNLSPHFRRTKAYKSLKADLKFLDHFLEPEKFLRKQTTFIEMPETVRFEEEITDLFKDFPETSRPENKPTAKPYHPEYQLLLGTLEIEELIFDAGKTVTVNAFYYENHGRKRLGLGFEFDELYQLLSAYCKPNTGILSYFNKTRQRIATDVPTVVNLKEKHINKFSINQHYFRVYKPQALGRDGRLEEMAEAFYLVDQILDKRPYDAEERKQLQSEINGWFHHIKNWYPGYLSDKARGLPEAEARRNNGLENHQIFELSRLFYFLEKHGGKAEINDLR